MLDILVIAIQVVDGPSLLCGSVEQIYAKSEKGFLIVQHAQNGRQDVYLLRYLVLHLRLTISITRLINNYR